MKLRGGRQVVSPPIVPFAAGRADEPTPGPSRLQGPDAGPSRSQHKRKTKTKRPHIKQGVRKHARGLARKSSNMFPMPCAGIFQNFPCISGGIKQPSIYVQS